MPLDVTPEIVVVEAAGVQAPFVAATGKLFSIVYSVLPAANVADVYASTFDAAGKVKVKRQPVDETAGDVQSDKGSITVTKDGTFVAGLDMTLDPGPDRHAGARYAPLGKTGTPNGSPQDLSRDFSSFYNDFTNSGNYTHVAGLDGGRVLAVWRDLVETGNATFSAALRMKVIGSPETTLDIDPNSSSNPLGTDLSLVGLTSGGYAISWCRGPDGVHFNNAIKVFSRTGATVRGRFTAPLRYKVAVNGECSPSSGLAAQAGNGFAYAWREARPFAFVAGTSNRDVFVQRYDAKGKSLGAPILVNTQVEPSEQSADDLAVAGFSDGRLIVVWSHTAVRDTIAATRNVLMGQILSANGTPIGKNFEIAARNGFDRFSKLDVAVMGSDRFVVTFRERLLTGSARVVTRVFSTASKGVTRTGGSKPDRLNGGKLNDLLAGKGGKDTLSGDKGDDILDGGAAGDVLKGGPGSDTARYTTAVTVDLSGKAKATGEALGDSFSSIENLEGSAKNDTLTGNDEVNLIIGNSGDDRITGGKLPDQLRGGAGRDRFILTEDKDIGDSLLDFTSGTDKIEIRQSGFKQISMALAPAFASGPKVPDTTSTATFFYDTSLRRLVYRNGLGWYEFARLPATASLKASDIVIKP